MSLRSRKLKKQARYAQAVHRARAEAAEHFRLEDLYRDVFPIASTLDRGTPVVLICRVSSREQKKNLPAQIGQCVEEIHNLGLLLKGIHACEMKASTPEWISYLVKLKDQFRVNTFVAEHMDRFLRSPRYGRYDLHSLPDQKQTQSFRYGCEREGITTAVLLPTDYDPDDLISRRSKRGRRLHGRNKKTYQQHRKNLLQPVAVRMVKMGFTHQEIAQNLCVPQGTLKAWIWGRSTL